MKDIPMQQIEFLNAMMNLSAINAARGQRFHKGGMQEWTVLEWAAAMCGEAGECANACKKLRRMELKSESKNNFSDRQAAIKAIASEAAGTFVYLDLLCTRLGIDFGTAIVEEFNRVSDREGFPEKL